MLLIAYVLRSMPNIFPIAVKSHAFDFDTGWFMKIFFLNFTGVSPCLHVGVLGALILPLPKMVCGC